MSAAQPVWPEAHFADLHRSPHTPLYHAIAARLEESIRVGALPPGARLENEIAISERLGVSRPTVRRAIGELVNRGLLVRRRGVGTLVVRHAVARPVALTSLFDDLSVSLHLPTTSVQELALVPATPDIAEKLGVSVGAEVTRIRRIRYLDGLPLAVMRNHLALGGPPLSSGALQERGLYQVLRSRGISLRVATQSIGARSCDADEARLLDLSPGSPVLTMDRVAFDDAGRAVEAGAHCYRPDRYRFETTLVSN